MRRSSVLVALLPALLATCRDFPSGPARGGRASVAIQPTFSAAASLAGFGLTADTVRLAVLRPPADTVQALTLFFDPDSSQIRLAADVVLRAPVETLMVRLELRGGGFALYSGAAPVELRVGRSAGAPLQIPMAYTGPGGNIAVLSVEPRDTVVSIGDSIRFRVSASDSSGGPVTPFFVKWTSSDSTVMPVNAAGRGRAPGARAVLSVHVRTPTGVIDSTPVTIIPAPTALALVSGGGQSGVAGAALPAPVRVRVTAADGFGVKGIPVRFAAATGTGGAVTDSVVVADTGGYAQTTFALGGALGPQAFTARALALPQLGFSATALPAAISPVTSTITTSIATVLSGSGATLTLIARDGFGNPLASGGASVAFLPSGGTSTGTVGATIDHGDGTYTATFVGVLAGSPTSIGATVDGVPVTSTLPTIGVMPGPISAATSVLTASAATIASGTAATLTLRGKDAAGNLLSSGGATVAFSAGGGTSSGTIGPTTDHADGSYTATLTGVLAGTALTVGATVGASPVGSAPPTVAVTPGVASPATSVLTSSSPTVTVNAATTLTLRTRDAAGNFLTGGGLTVAFTASGGPSVGTIGGTTDNGDGTYTATFTGVTAGTATTIGATIGGSPVTSTPVPTIVVDLGGTIPASSIITVSPGTLVSGTVATLTLTARDGAGSPVVGATVLFSHSGGLSSGMIGSVTENPNGIYTAPFTGVLAGAATTISATINGSPVTTTLPLITVVPGAISAATSTVTASAGSVLSGTVATLTLQGKDLAGNSLTSGGAAVAFATSGGVSTGTIGATTDNGNGTYTASFTGVLAGTPTTIQATIGGGAVTTPLPTMTVLPGPISPATSLVSTSSPFVVAGTSATLRLQARDAAGNFLTGGGSTVAFATAGGTSAGPISPVPATDNGDGTYSAIFTGLTAGTATTVGATIAGKPVTAPAPTITVTPAAASQLRFLTQPGDVLAGDTLPALQVAALDPFGNVDPSFKTPVTLAIGATPEPAAKLQGVTDVIAIAGIATFTDMSVDSAGAGFTLQAVSGNLTAATSVAFTVGGVIAALPVGQSPIAVGVNGKTNRVYVVNNGSGSVTVVDGGKLSVITTLSGIELPFGIGVNEETDKIYVSSAGTAALMVIDGATNAMLQIPAVGSTPKGVAVDPTSNTIYTTASVGTLVPLPSLVPIDGSKNAVILTGIVTLPAPGSGVAFHPLDRLVYVVLQTQDAVAVVDPAGAKLVTTIPVGRGPTGIAINPSTGLVYVTNTGEASLSVIDPAAAKEIARIPVGGSPQGLAVDAAGDRVWVANSADGTVSLVDGAKQVVIATLVVGPTPTDAGVLPANGRVFVPVSGQSALKVVRP